MYPRRPIPNTALTSFSSSRHLLPLGPVSGCELRNITIYICNTKEVRFPYKVELSIKTTECCKQLLAKKHYVIQFCAFSQQTDKENLKSKKIISNAGIGRKLKQTRIDNKSLIARQK